MEWDWAFVAEIMPTLQSELVTLLGADPKPGVVYHPPCTLQHGQQVRGKVEGLLSGIGIAVRLCADSHLCCGSAGTYSYVWTVPTGATNPVGATRSKYSHIFQ